MNEKKTSKSLFFILIFIVIIGIMAFVIYRLNIKRIEAIDSLTYSDKKTENLQNEVNILQDKIDKTANTLSENNENKVVDSNLSKGTVNNSTNEVEYIIVSVGDEISTIGPEYKEKKISDKQKIDDLLKIVDNTTKYESKTFIADFQTETPPMVEVYLSNGEKYSFFAGDGINDGGDIVNLLVKWYKTDQSDKTLYKTEIELAKYIENLYED